MKHILHLSFLLSVVLLSSCAFHSGVMHGSASLNGDNFVFKTIGIGSAKTTHVFGIGGLSQRTLIYSAKKDLYRNYPLTHGQAYANVSVDFKRSFYFVVNTTIATVTADIIQFDPTDTSIYDENHARIIHNPEYEDSTAAPLFHADQMTGLFTRMKLVKVRILEPISEKPNKYLVEYLQPENGNIKVVKENAIFLLGEHDSIPGNDFRVGDAANFEYARSGSEPLGTVIAVGTGSILIKSKFKPGQDQKLLEFKTNQLKIWNSKIKVVEP